MDKKNKKILVRGIIYYVSLLSIVWIILFISVFCFNGGDTYKWNGKPGAFYMGMFFSFPIITGFSIGNYLSLFALRNWIIGLDNLKLFFLELVIVGIFILTSMKTEIMYDLVIDGNGVLFLIVSGIVGISSLGFIVSLIVFFLYKQISSGLTSR